MGPRAATARLAAAAAAAAVRSNDRGGAAAVNTLRTTTAPAAAAAAAAAPSASASSASRWSLLRSRAPPSHLSWWRRRCYSTTSAATAAAPTTPSSETNTYNFPLNGAPPLLPASWAAAAATAAAASPAPAAEIPPHALEAYAALERAAASKAPEIASADERAELSEALQRWLGGGRSSSAVAADGAARRAAQQLLVPAAPLALPLASSFCKLAYKGMTLPLAEAIGALEDDGGKNNPNNLAWLLLQAHALAHLPQAVAARRAASNALDLHSPPQRFPYARALKRRIVYHAGPTNSGKTYSALQALKAAKRGVYCGPLRLLAMEVYERLNSEEGVRCSLVTGQEVLRVPGANHVACTVEMAALHSHADVAVLDEIQMLGDEQRGSAWTRALLGLPANELHVCGDPSAVGLVASLAAACGDAFELRRYERFAPLEIDQKGLPNGLADVQPGDCVVAFSRRAIFEARRQVEALTGRRAAVVYGALPAETRREQARGFNDPAEGTPQVLVASDAVGLGLNFNIRRVVFHAMTKTIVTTTDKLPPKKDGDKGAKRRKEWEGKRGGGEQGEEDSAGGGARPPPRQQQQRPPPPPRPVRLTVPVPVTLVKQIAGRAGRRNSQWPNGLATTLKSQDLPALRRALFSPLKALRTPAAGLSPDADALEAVAARLGGCNARLDRVIELWQREVSLDGAGRFFLCDASQLMAVARAVGGIGTGRGGGGAAAGAAGAASPPPSPLSLADRFTLAAAPVDTADPRCMAAFMRFARDLAAGGPVRQPFRWAFEGEDVRVPAVVEEEEEEEEEDDDERPKRRRRRRRRPPPPRFPVGGVFLSSDSHPHADDGTPPLRLPTSAPNSVLEMADLEAAHKVLSLWLWLSHRYDAHLFPARGSVADAAAKLCVWLSDGLRATSELGSRAGGGEGNGGGEEAEEAQDEEAEEEERERRRRDENESDGGGAAADNGPPPPTELNPYDWRHRQLWRLLSRRGEWRGVRGGQAYTEEDGGGEEWWWRRKGAPKRETRARAARATAAAAAAAAAGGGGDALRFAHPPVPADAAALLSPGGGLAGGGGGALAAAALLPRRAAGAAGVPLPPGAAAAVAAEGGGRGGASGGAGAAASASSAAHPHAWLIALGDADPLAALMHSSEWDPSMSRFLRPRQHGRLVIPLAPAPAP